MGRTLHYLFDAVLFSALLSGIKRTGLEFNTNYFENASIKNILGMYLGMGDSVFDFTIQQLVKLEIFKKR
jgi:hypothetical protein